MNAKRVLVVGSNGLLGQKVSELLVRGSSSIVTLVSYEKKSVRQFLSADYEQIDITSNKEVKRVVAERKPDIIVNCAAMTNVDECEKERELAWKINVEGVEHLIEAARKTEAKVFHVSSDYIFDGKLGPYDEEARPAPVNYYGKTKLASENALRSSGLPYFIARTMVLYGFAQGVKSNFALWLIQNLEQGKPVRVVDDQVGNPTLADDLAHGIVSAIELNRSGIYNLAGRNILDRYECALQLAKIFGFNASLISPIKTSQLRQPAARPLKSGLITLKAEVELGYKPSSVEEGLLILKKQLSRTMKRMPDSAPLPRAMVSRQGKR